MQISELAQRTSVSVHALRHYERLGLLQPLRRPNGYRDYPAELQREVVFIAMSRQLGFSLPQIAALQAQKSRVAEHQAWLLAQQAAARRPGPGAVRAAWPKVRPARTPHAAASPPTFANPSRRP